MAIKSVITSDISGKEVPESDRAIIIVSGHPSVSGSVELDVRAEEAAKFESAQLNLVTLTIQQPGSRTAREVVMDAETFNAHFKNADVPTLLRGARRSADGQTTRRQRTSSTPKGDKVDYATIEHAGSLHRGRITEAEAQLVRDNLDAINKRLKAEGGRHIDPNDEAEKRRYGF